MAAFVRLLGPPAVRHDDGWLELPVGKTSALLYYLAYQGGWAGRDDLLYLFWPDASEHSARQNLRPVLSKLRRLPFAGALETKGDRIRWPVRTDLHTFREALSEERWAAAWQGY
jgi:DNA-binding SARP family transcriptional activator